MRGDCDLGDLCRQTSGEVALGGTFLLTGLIFLIFSILLLHRLRYIFQYPEDPISELLLGTVM